MSVLRYPQAVAVLFNKTAQKVAMKNTLQAWHIELVEADGVISTVPVLVRVQADGSRIPWAPSTVDIVNGEFVVLDDGFDESSIVLLQASSAWAFDKVLTGKMVRRISWKKGMHAVFRNGEIHLVLPNGKELDSEYHPDFFDMDGDWEIYADS